MTDKADKNSFSGVWEWKPDYSDRGQTGNRGSKCELPFHKILCGKNRREKEVAGIKRNF